MNNDLISRSELRKEVERIFCVGSYHKDRIIYLINNAPTVDAVVNTIEVRPQGEWIYDDLFNNWKCSVCGECPKTVGYVGDHDFMKEHFKFCNHCGADMRGGAE